MLTGRPLCLLAALFAAASLAATNLSAEQSGEGCKRCSSMSGGGGGLTGPSSGAMHSFGGPVCTGTTESACKDCHAFNACHTNLQNGNCEDFHWACGQTQAGLDAYEHADAMSESAVRLAVATAPRELRWSAAGYLVRVNCEGLVVEAKRVRYGIPDVVALSRSGALLHQPEVT